MFKTIVNKPWPLDPLNPNSLLPCSQTFSLSEPPLCAIVLVLARRETVALGHCAHECFAMRRREPVLPLAHPCLAPCVSAPCPKLPRQCRPHHCSHPRCCVHCHVPYPEQSRRRSPEKLSMSPFSILKLQFQPFMIPIPTFVVYSFYISLGNVEIA